MYNLCIFMIFIIIILICILIFKDIISPPVINSLMWCIPIGFIALTEIFSDNPYTFNSNIYIIIIGIFAFILGFMLINKETSKNDNKLVLMEKLVPQKRIILLYVIEVVVFIVFLLDVYLYVKGHFKYNFWFSYKWAMNMGYYKEYAFIPVFRTVSRLFTWILFIIFLNNGEKKYKKLFLIQLFISLLYVAFGQGRSGIFALIIPLFIIYILLKRESAKKILKVLIKMSLFLLVIFLFYAKLKSPYVNQDIYFYLSKLENYLSGGIVAFCKWYNPQFIIFENGRCTFRFFFALLHSVGFNVNVRTLVEPYIENLNGNIGNVYTIYKWYSNDFGAVYAIFIQFLIGMFHGFLYNRLYQKRTINYLLWHSIFYYPLMLQFFMDEYLSLTSIYLQYLIVIIIISNTNFFFKKE